MDIELITPGTFDVMTLGEAKTFLGYPDTITDRDDLIFSCLKASQNLVQKNSSHIYATSTYKGYLDKMATNIYLDDILNITSIDSITYYDGDNAEQTLNTSDYYGITSNDYRKAARIYIVNTKSTYSRPNAVTINFTCGYSDQANVPEEYKQAVRYFLKHFYDQPELVAATQLHEVPKGGEYLINNLSKKYFV